VHVKPEAGRDFCTLNIRFASVSRLNEAKLLLIGTIGLQAHGGLDLHRIHARPLVLMFFGGGPQTAQLSFPTIARVTAYDY